MNSSGPKQSTVPKTKPSIATTVQNSSVHKSSTKGSKYTPFLWLMLFYKCHHHHKWLKGYTALQGWEGRGSDINPSCKQLWTVDLKTELKESSLMWIRFNAVFRCLVVSAPFGHPHFTGEFCEWICVPKWKLGIWIPDAHMGLLCEMPVCWFIPPHERHVKILSNHGTRSVI